MSQLESVVAHCCSLPAVQLRCPYAKCQSETTTDWQIVHNTMSSHTAFALSSLSVCMCMACVQLCLRENEAVQKCAAHKIHQTKQPIDVVTSLRDVAVIVEVKVTFVSLPACYMQNPIPATTEPDLPNVANQLPVYVDHNVMYYVTFVSLRQRGKSILFALLMIHRSQYSVR